MSSNEEYKSYGYAWDRFLGYSVLMVQPLQLLYSYLNPVFYFFVLSDFQESMFGYVGSLKKLLFFKDNAPKTNKTTSGDDKVFTKPVRTLAVLTATLLLLFTFVAASTTTFAVTFSNESTNMLYAITKRNYHQTQFDKRRQRSKKLV